MQKICTLFYFLVLTKLKICSILFIETRNTIKTIREVIKMTNVEIIASAMAANEIDFDLEVDTIVGWNRKGFKVKKGEHAAFKTKIWKPRKRTKEELKELAENGESEDTKSRLILVNANFFTEEQVEKDTRKKK